VIRATRGTSFLTRAVARVRLVILAVVVAALTGCSASGGPSSATIPTGSSAATGLSTFQAQGLVFDYPTAWREFHYEELSTMSNLIAYLGTVDVPAPCLTTTVAGGVQTECRDRYQLLPNSLVVAIRSNGNPMFDILDRPAGATLLTVGSLPGYRAVASPGPDDTTGAETIVTTTLAVPGSVDNYYTITAAMRGPDLGPLQAQVDAMITSLRYDPPVVPLPSGSGAAAAAAGSALAVLGKDSPAWACFVPVGTHQLVIDSLPMGPALAHPQLATCTSVIEATPLQLWRMTLTMRLSEPDANAGSGQTFVVWVNPDGTPGQTSGGPLVP
jgi:hypothetical protein